MGPIWLISTKISGPRISRSPMPTRRRCRTLQQNMEDIPYCPNATHGTTTAYLSTRSWIFRTVTREVKMKITDLRYGSGCSVGALLITLPPTRTQPRTRSAEAIWVMYLPMAWKAFFAFPNWPAIFTNRKGTPVFMVRWCIYAIIGRPVHQLASPS